mgnify:CR=1 FL=1
MPFPLTEEQQKIVDDRGGQLLVSAAAGSGKTRVLVERLMDRVTREGEDIDRFLVITYTKAAAAELRGRIAQELSARLAQTPGDRRLRRQSTLIYQAPISTIHSFCADLLRENSHLLELDPDFRLCDEGEGLAIQAQVLDLIKNLKKAQNTSLILITHDLGIVADICDQVAVIYAGEIVEWGSLEEIYDHPTHPYTIGLFGAIPDLNSKVRRLSPIEGLPPDPTDLPQGCYFAPRCPHATDSCRAKHPTLQHLGGSHYCLCDKINQEG